MNERVFHTSLVLVSVAFVAYFSAVVVPPLLESGDVLGAFAAGFANPYSSGYSADVLGCWVILFIWVIYEARVFSVRGGWVCLVLATVPGVVVGLTVYLILRSLQISEIRPPNT